MTIAQGAPASYVCTRLERTSRYSISPVIYILLHHNYATKNPFRLPPDNHFVEFSGFRKAWRRHVYIYHVHSGRFAAMIPTMANTKVKIMTTKGRTSHLQETQEMLLFLFFFRVGPVSCRYNNKILTNPKLQANQRSTTVWIWILQNLSNRLSDFGAWCVFVCLWYRWSFRFFCDLALNYIANSPCCSLKIHTKFYMLWGCDLSAMWILEMAHILSDLQKLF